MKLPVILSLIFLITPPKTDLTNTKWVHLVNKSCTDTLMLQPRGKMLFYSCEQNYKLKGTFKISNDTLLVTETDDSHSEDGGKANILLFKYKIINKRELVLLYKGVQRNGKLVKEHINSSYILKQI